MSQSERIQDKTKRIRNFKEVSLGFSKADAFEEARRFPQLSDHSRDPKCPLDVDISSFFRILREGDIAGALKKIKEQNDFPAICGRVCSAPCEQEFVLEGKRAPIGIRALERFAADHGKKWSFHHKRTPCQGKKIAVIGSGPSGILAAAQLAKKDFQVTIFELLPLAGGILSYGIPSFRLPKDVLEKEFEELQYLGVKIITNASIGYAMSVEDIFKQGFSAVLLALGTGGEKISSLPGIHLGGVYFSEEILLNINLSRKKFLADKESLFIGEKVVVIGSNDAALDCARICARLDKKVMIVSEGTESELGSCPQERNYAKEEGVVFEPLKKVLHLMSGGRNFVCGIKCVSLDYADPHQTGEWLLMPVPDSEVVLEADTVIIASEKRLNKTISHLVPDLKIRSNGSLWIDEETGMTSQKGIFACGDILTGSGILIEAMASGKKVTGAIENYLLQSE